jgi:hypothetical protein
MKRLKELGFKKIKTEPGFHMYELTPAKLQAFDENFRPQAASDARSVKTANKLASKRAHKLDK